MCFGWRPRKTEPAIRADEEEEMPDVFVTRPTMMNEMGTPRDTKIVTKVESCEFNSDWKFLARFSTLSGELEKTSNQETAIGLIQRRANKD